MKSPTLTRTSLTLPPFSASTGISIFIDSRTTTVCPADTSSPALTSTVNTVPAIVDFNSFILNFLLFLCLPSGQNISCIVARRKFFGSGKSLEQREICPDSRRTRFTEKLYRSAYRFFSRVTADDHLCDHRIIERCDCITFRVSAVDADPLTFRKTEFRNPAR